MKYKLTEETKCDDGTKLYRIQALINIPSHSVKAGDLGGWVQSEDNLSQDDTAWVFGNAQVYGNACVSDDALVYGNACVSDDALVYGEAQVYGEAHVFCSAQVHGKAHVFGNARVYGNAQVSGKAWVHGDAYVSGYTAVYGYTRVSKATPTQEEQAEGTELVARLQQMSQDLIKERAHSATLADRNTVLTQAIHQTLADNLNLADGNCCTLKLLKDAVEFDRGIETSALL